MAGGYEPLDSEPVYSGRILSVNIERFRHDDGEVATREIVHTTGAVAIVAIDEDSVWLVRQPREAVGQDDLLELPAGRLDVEGEAPLETAKRELAEEIGRGAEHWERLLWFWSGAGFTDDRVELFLASDLYEQHADSGENERIEVVRWPLERLDEAIAECRDAKTLIGLLALARRLRG